MAKSELETSLFGRSAKLLSTAAKLARTEVGHQIGKRLSKSDNPALKEIEARIKQAEILADSLSKLKGAVMKAGQWLSIDAADLLPPEALAVLSRVQADADPVPFTVIEGVIKSALGEQKLAALNLEAAPAASASIGQVHRGRLENRSVAVKVQYPGIAAAVESDLAVLQNLAQGWLSAVKREVNLAPVFAELSTLLHQEADYTIELASLQRYGNLLSSHPQYLVPQAYTEYSTKEVITMSWEEGLSITRWLDTHPSVEAREWLARSLLDLFCLEFFEGGFVQTDPNPANFLVRESKRQVVLLDLGAALAYDLSFRQNYVALLRTMRSEDPQVLIAAGIEHNLLDPRESEEARQLFAEMLRLAVEPFGARQPFDFSDADYLARTREVSLRFMRALKYSPPPRSLMFLHRKLGGMFNLLKRFQVRLDLVPYWEKMVTPITVAS